MALLTELASATLQLDDDGFKVVTTRDQRTVEDRIDLDCFSKLKAEPLSKAE